MKSEVLLAIILKKVEEKLNATQSPPRGPRGQRGSRGESGESGKDFVFTEHEPQIRKILEGAILSTEEIRGPRGRDGRDGRDGKDGVDGKSLAFEDLSKEQIEQLRGTRGRDGRDGTDGKDFVLSEHEETFRNWAKEFALKFEDLTQENREALRGARGRDGKDGTSFDFSEHAETIKQWVEDFRLRFEDLNAEQISAIRGPAGRNGKDGKDGKDFDFNSHAATIKEWSKGFALKFSDLAADEIELLRGPRGREGRDGRDFNFEEHRGSIKELVTGLVGEIRDQLKLRFDDLSTEEIELLRGPRGRDGRDGRDFIFDDYREYFDSLRPKFSDFTKEERDSITLKFSHLTEDQKNSLKIRFEDFTLEERMALRGWRGPRGQRGISGRDGKDGLSIRGLPGPQGMPGMPGPPGEDGEDGIDGEDGVDGEDAAEIISIEIDQYRKDEFEFIFNFSNGDRIRSDAVKIPSPKNHYYYDGGSWSSKGSDSANLGNAKNSFNLVPSWDGANTTYSLPEIPLSDNDLTVWLSGSMRTDYTLDANDIIFNFDARDQVCDAHFRWGVSATNSFASKVKSLSGNWDGTNTTYILPVTPISSDEIVVTLGGSMRNDYTLNGAKVIFNFNSTDQVFDADVRYGASTPASSTLKVKALTPSYDGSDTTYTLPASPISYDELTVWLSGSERTDYSFSGSSVTFVGQDTRDQVFDAQFRY